MTSERDLGRALATYARTPAQNVGAGCFVLVFLAFPAAALGLATSWLGYAAGAAAALVCGGAAALIVRQVVPNRDLRWTVYERGFSRTRGGATEVYPYAAVRSVEHLPQREALVRLTSGATLRIEALAEGAALAAMLDTAAFSSSYDDAVGQLERGEELTLGPLTFTDEALLVRGGRFAWGELAWTEAVEARGAGGSELVVWTIEDRATGARVELLEHEFAQPALARALLGYVRARHAAGPRAVRR